MRQSFRTTSGVAGLLALIAQIAALPAEAAEVSSFRGVYLGMALPAFTKATSQIGFGSALYLPSDRSEFRAVAQDAKSVCVNYIVGNDRIRGVVKKYQQSFVPIGDATLRGAIARDTSAMSDVAGTELEFLPCVFDVRPTTITDFARAMVKAYSVNGNVFTITERPPSYPVYVLEAVSRYGELFRIEGEDYNWSLHVRKADQSDRAKTNTTPKF